MKRPYKKRAFANLDESKTACTLQEVAERLKSKSINHAGFYINNLMEEGKVVRIDYMVYTSPKKAFEGVNIAAIVSVINSIMNVANIIVEADVFREYVNLELGLSYSKYFYMALVNVELEKLNWFRNNSLYSKENIPYKNLMDMCKQLCNPDLSKSANIMILKKSVWLTDGVISNAFRQWQRK